jgi:hypothetical protein
MATRVRSLVAFLICQGLQELCASANFPPQKQRERKYKKAYHRLLLSPKPFSFIMVSKNFKSYE